MTRVSKGTPGEASLVLPSPGTVVRSILIGLKMDRNTNIAQCHWAESCVKVGETRLGPERTISGRGYRIWSSMKFETMRLKSSGASRLVRCPALSTM